MTPARVVIISHDLSGNSVGRAHVLWELLAHLDTPTLVIGTASRRGLWTPLERSEFAEDVVPCPSHDAVTRALASETRPGDLLLPVKTWPGSLGVAVRIGRQKRLPVLVDIDDPDHAALVGRWASRPYRHAYRLRLRLRGVAPRDFDNLDLAARRLPRLVSNPSLQELYDGGDIIPHARRVHETPPPPTSRSREIRVAFVGTPRAHKGLDMVRQAVTRHAHRGFTLTITADPPRRPHPWETWTGATSMEDGRRIVEESDICVVPQLLQGYGHAQLPAKLIDAMASGRAIVAGRTPPIEWALGDAGIVVDLDGSDPSSLAAALARLEDRSKRQRLGRAAHARAWQRFSIPAVARILETSIERLADRRHPEDNSLPGL